MHARDLDYVEGYTTSADTLSFYAEHDPVVAVTGYDWLVPFELYDHSGSMPVGTRFKLHLSESSGSIEVSEGSKPLGKVSLAPVIERLEKDEPHRKGDLEPIHLPGEPGDLRLHVVLTQLSVERRGEHWVPTSCAGSLLVGE